MGILGILWGNPDYDGIDRFLAVTGFRKCRGKKSAAFSLKQQKHQTKRAMLSGTPITLLKLVLCV